MTFCEQQHISLQCLLVMGIRTYLQKINTCDDVSMQIAYARRATLQEKKSGGTRIHWPGLSPAPCCLPHRPDPSPPVRYKNAYPPDKESPRNSRYNKAYERCESMRARLVYDRKEEEWYQYIVEKEDREIEYVDFTGKTMEESEAEMTAWTRGSDSSISLWK